MLKDSGLDGHRLLPSGRELKALSVLGLVSILRTKLAEKWHCPVVAEQARFNQFIFFVAPERGMGHFVALVRSDQSSHQWIYFDSVQALSLQLQFDLGKMLGWICFFSSC